MKRASGIRKPLPNTIKMASRYLQLECAQNIPKRVVMKLSGTKQEHGHRCVKALELRHKTCSDIVL